MTTVGDRNFIRDLVSSVELKFLPTDGRFPGHFLNKAPFKFTQKAWGSFDVHVNVSFHKEFGLPVQKWEHSLVFNKSGAKQRSTLWFDRVLVREIQKAGGIWKYRKGRRSVGSDQRGISVKKNPTFNRF